ncbi:MAG: carboxypeptidase-like regulatory domain-containing protein [Acidobacteriota bacterium]
MHTRSEMDGGQDFMGTLVGRVTLADGQAIPGVLVTAASPAMAGERTCVSQESGQYVMRNLPPGSYDVSFQLEGFAPVEESAEVLAGSKAQVDVTMQVTSQEEA